MNKTGRKRQVYWNQESHIDGTWKHIKPIWFAFSAQTANSIGLTKWKGSITNDSFRLSYLVICQHHSFSSFYPKSQEKEITFPECSVITALCVFKFSRFKWGYCNEVFFYYKENKSIIIKDNINNAMIFELLSYPSPSNTFCHCKFLSYCRCTSLKSPKQPQKNKPKKNKQSNFRISLSQ